MIKHWLKLALQSTYQGGARYAGARTRYGLTATRARPQTTRTSGREDDQPCRGRGHDGRFTRTTPAVAGAAGAAPQAARPREPLSEVFCMHRPSPMPAATVAVAVTSIPIRSPMPLTATLTATAPDAGARPRTSVRPGYVT
jgi:hypothetical protein